MTSQSDASALYAEYARQIHRYLWLRTRDDELSADLTQECFTRLLTHRGRPIEAPLPFLYTLAGRLLTDHRRRHDTWRTDSWQGEALDAVSDDRRRPDDIYEARRRLDALARALGRLPERSREVFRLCRIDGLSYDQTAQRLRISKSAVQKHLTLAMRYILDQTDPS